MRRWLLVICLLSCTSAFATHIAGGELFYTYQGPGGAANTDRYLITMRLFRVCGPVGPNFAGLDGEQVRIGIYQTSTLQLVGTQLLAQQFFGDPPQVQNTFGSNPCLVPFVSVCYQVGTYSATVDLPKTADGYTLSWIRYTRTALDNVTGAEIGATFTTKIPGTSLLPTGNNSCPQFAVRDTMTVCKSNSFILDFSATDADGDSLAYKFTPAYNGFGGGLSNPNPSPPNPLQLIQLNYPPPYSGTNPLGTNAVINPNTGIISGIAPASPGSYVICVVVEEWRNGVKINDHRKDFILRIADCSLAAADLTPDIYSCDGFTWNFENQSTNPNIASYLWVFGDGDSATTPTPTHAYADTGVYKVKLYVVSTGGCKDSAKTNMHVFPGFTPNFTVVGSCYQQPIVFHDATHTDYGVVNSWRWDFGDLTTLKDTSTHKDTAWQYTVASTTDSVLVRLISTNSKGCTDTIAKKILVRDKPTLTLPFRDTLICSIDTLMLQASSTGAAPTYSWSSGPYILFSNTNHPLVFPKDTTMYYVTANDDGCVNKDSVKVNVLDFITVDAGPDSTICKTDIIQLHPVSQALNYHWTASTGEVVNPVKYPSVQPSVTTTYFVTGNVGKCQDNSSVIIKVVPYPVSAVSQDTTLCFGEKVQLHGTITGSAFHWTPSNSLLNPNTLNPIAGPSKTTAYILTVTDTLGCPKPKTDTVIVTVIPPVNVFAGNDTSIVMGQPLQLTAISDSTGTFLWTPSSGLSNPNIYNPIATLGGNVDSIKYKVRLTLPEGCIGEDQITVRIFKTAPDIFVPSGFTPNGDKLNDILKPITVGIKKLKYFRVYNRWGQLLFETSEFNRGWDGNFGDKGQPSGTYVYMAEGIDYTDKPVFRKGTVVLIR